MCSRLCLSYGLPSVSLLVAIVGVLCVFSQGIFPVGTSGTIIFPFYKNTRHTVLGSTLLLKAGLDYPQNSVSR